MSGLLYLYGWVFHDKLNITHWWDPHHNKFLLWNVNEFKIQSRNEPRSNLWRCEQRERDWDLDTLVDFLPAIQSDQRCNEPLVGFVWIMYTTPQYWILLIRWWKYITFHPPYDKVWVHVTPPYCLLLAPFNVLLFINVQNTYKHIIINNNNTKDFFLSKLR
jgi:hypothetical protein